MENYASLLGCESAGLPMDYLGIQVGANPGKVKTWEPILKKFSKKLASWKISKLSMAGRLVLLKSALCNLPLYYDSIYKMSIQVAMKLERMQRDFLWGMTGKTKKMHYVRWEVVQRPRTHGGLGIQSMIEKNMALLAKWWWKLITSRDGLWRRMVVEKYAIKDPHNLNRVSSRNSKMSRSWRDILKIVQSNSEVGQAFREGIKLKLGKGDETDFWEDIWIGDRPLKALYPKLWELAVNKHAKVSDMGS
ncbi:hypothetical protein QQ045_019094 [Rhodiola kirilowii]